MKSHHKAALGVAAGRTLIGLYALADPGRISRSWLGSHVDDVTASLFGRTLGARDLGLGAGAVWALAGRRNDRQVVAGLVAAGAMADLTDAAVTFAAWRSLPSPWKQLTAAAALGSGVTGGVVAGLIAAG